MAYRMGDVTAYEYTGDTISADFDGKDQLADGEEFLADARGGQSQHPLAMAFRWSAWRPEDPGCGKSTIRYRQRHMLPDSIVDGVNLEPVFNQEGRVCVGRGMPGLSGGYFAGPGRKHQTDAVMRQEF